MTIFSRDSITFVSVNVLRVLSIVAILLALSGEIVVMVNDIQGYKNSLPSPAAPSSSPASATHTGARFMVRRATLTYLTTDVTSPTSTIVKVTKAKATAAATSALAVATSAPAPTASAQLAAVQTQCSYVGNTSVPKNVGGILFSTLDRIFACLLLFMMLASEMPPPTPFTQRFWTYAFPPFGETFGVGVLGVIQVFVGCAMLSKSVAGLPQVAGWFLFIVGFLNILFGLAFSHKIKELRAIFSPRSHASNVPASSRYRDEVRIGYPESIPPPPTAHSVSSASGKGKPITIAPAREMEERRPPTYM